MAYCTQADIEKQLPKDRLVQLTDDDGDGLSDSGIVAEAIQKADDEINAHAAKRYSVPFSPVPTLIKTIAVDLTIWNLYARRALENETVTKRYDRAITLLAGLAKGIVSVGETPGPAEVEAGEPEATTSPEEDRVFTKETLKNF